MTKLKIYETKVTNFYKDNKISFELIKRLLISSKFFILFSFLNAMLPIVICLLTTRLTYGSYAVIGIGFVTTFSMAFNQMGLGYSIYSSFFYLNKNNHKTSKLNDKKNLVYNILFLAMLLGVIFAIIYFVTSYTYTKYANIHVNTVDSLPYAYDFIYSSIPYVLLATTQYSLIMFANNQKGEWFGILQLIISLILKLVFLLCFIFLTNLDGIGIGLSLSISSTISVIISIVVLYFWTDVFKGNKFKIIWADIKLIIKSIWRPLIVVLTIQIFKACALLLLSVQIPDDLVNAVPLDYQMARIIWYNMMYLIPFVLNGMADAINYFFIKNDFWFRRNRKEIRINLVVVTILFITIIVSVLLVVLCHYSINWLSMAYASNNNHSYSDTSISNNLLQVGKETMIDYVNNMPNFSTTSKNQIIDIINKLPTKQLQALIDSTLLPKFIAFNAVNINNMLTFPKSFTYFYLFVYCILYGTGQVFTSFHLSITKEKQKVVLLSLAQFLAILFVVEFGITFQRTQKFYLMEAWSFPLLIIGMVAIIYMSFTYFIEMARYNHKMDLKDKKTKKKKHNTKK